MEEETVQNIFGPQLTGRHGHPDKFSLLALPDQHVDEGPLPGGARRRSRQEDDDDEQERSSRLLTATTAPQTMILTAPALRMLTVMKTYRRMLMLTWKLTSMLRKTAHCLADPGRREEVTLMKVKVALSDSGASFLTETVLHLLHQRV